MQFNKALFSNKEIVKDVANFLAIQIGIHFQVIKYVPFNLPSIQDHNFITSIYTAISTWFDYYREVALTWAWSLSNWNALRFVAQNFGLFTCRIVDLLPQWATGGRLNRLTCRLGHRKCSPNVLLWFPGGMVGLGATWHCIRIDTSRNLFVNADYADLSALHRIQIGICHCDVPVPTLRAAMIEKLA